MFIHNLHHKFHFHTWMFVLIAVAVSLFYPSLGLSLESFVVPLMMLLMFVSFLNIDYHSMAERMHHFKKPSITLLIIHLLSPLLVLLAKPLFIQEVFIGLIIAATVSSGISVVFLSNLFKGNPSIALLITFFSNLLSPIIIPTIIYLFTKQVIDIDYIAISLTIVKLIIIPLLAAMTIHKLSCAKKLAKQSIHISTIILFLVILGIVSPVQKFIFANPIMSLKLLGIVTILVSINFFVGYALGKTKEEKITYGISSSYKNYALASVIALSNFEPVVALPAAMYAVVNNLFLVPMQIILLKQDKNHKPAELTKAVDTKKSTSSKIKKVVKKTTIKKKTKSKSKK